MTIINIYPLYFITFGRSRIWFASRRSSSKLLAYRIMSSGTVLKVQCRLSTYSTWRLHPFKKPGTHLNILRFVVVDVLLKRLHEDLYLMTTQYFHKSHKLFHINILHKLTIALIFFSKIFTLFILTITQNNSRRLADHSHKKTSKNES